MSVNFQIIQTMPELEEAIAYLEKFPIVGMDLEGEFNLHRYGMHLCLLQLSDGKEVFLLDPLKLDNLDPFFRLYENPEVKKISHGPHSDFLLLNNLYKRNPKNTYDTQKAAIFLDMKGTSLSALLDEFFGIEKNTKIREKDWGQRPLPEIMLDYAAKDVLYLPELYDILRKKLIEIGRDEWVEEENRLLEGAQYVPKENPHLSIKGSSRLSAREAMILKYIHGVRDQIAQKLNKPASFIIQNPRLIDLSQEPPSGPEGWRSLRQVHPRLKQYAELFHDAVIEGKSAPIPRRERKGTGPGFKYLIINDQEFKDRYNIRKDELGKLREYLDQDYDIAPMILSNKTIHRLASGTPPEEALKNWQRGVILKMAAEKDIPHDYLEIKTES